MKRFGSWWLLVLSIGACFLEVDSLDAASLTLTPEEQVAFDKSAAAVRELVDKLKL